MKCNSALSARARLRENPPPIGCKNRYIYNVHLNRHAGERAFSFADDADSRSARAAIVRYMSVQAAVYAWVRRFRSRFAGRGLLW